MLGSWFIEKICSVCRSYSPSNLIVSTNSTSNPITLVITSSKRLSKTMDRFDVGKLGIDETELDELGRLREIYFQDQRQDPPLTRHR